MRFIKGLCLILLLFSSYALYAQTVPSKQPIYIGVIYNTTGSYAPVGIASLNGAKLAVQQINSHGGVLNRPLALVVKNADTNAKTTKKVAKQLANNPQVPIIMGLNNSSLTLAAMPAINKAKKVFITTGSTSAKQLLAKFPNYLYFACFSNAAAGIAAAEFAEIQLNAKKAIVIYNKDHLYTISSAHAFAKTFVQHGGKILKTYWFAKSNYQLNNLMKKVKPYFKETDLVFLASTPPQSPQQVRDIRAAGYKGIIMSGGEFDYPGFQSLAGSAANNVYYTSHVYFSNKSPLAAVRQYISAYNKAYGESPNTPFSALAYDTVYLIAKAINNANSTNPEKIKEALGKIIHFQGVTGNISYIENSHSPAKSINIIGIHNGVKQLEAILASKPTQVSSNDS